MLTNNQILYISNDLKSKELSAGFRPEALDHICCMVERHLITGLQFREAYALALLDFGDQGFTELKQTSPIIQQKRKTMIQQLLTSSLAASIFCYVFNVSITDRPSMHPIAPETVITSSFGLRVDPISKTKKPHHGIDFKSPSGTPIKASGDGVILFAEPDGFYGNKVIIQHDKEYQSIYAHLGKIMVETGQTIKKGEIIGTVGNTGRTTAPHLHFEITQNGKHVDPAAYLLE
ncbi:M23 family metallopeptidase [Reichenbachiella agariperforans]|uniref:Peptidase family M23 n=1 Tax=Reichenbachiella agariperforans TaxID=156994 RepID=A0A1M6RGM2_REIAG|nr:M23 family metallopeptidase [Reichenbachiella agariperforans]MBU2915329.1 M23 family metallopeptidase [Reichenbachiella agariperforans]SHK31624.1 Peptidase family M23 [Reichenbachiella agariperforans]